jgi:hypothetical protein
MFLTTKIKRPAGTGQSWSNFETQSSQGGSKMEKEKPVDEGNDPGFPPSAQPDTPETSEVGSAPSTTVSDGLIGEACSTAYDLGDVADPNK